ncbi:SecDF P1 head subdomain-containing protein [Luteipulveratus mongoliensis]|uniref:SecDF P1 head subdomain domain-containing protein n=1 Tax=Luteipulveratus mongoliensis TaxID=571913 RepID=A0A0K1JHP0_9MICO|nr:hypothetical protein [Luteipulveratus mongoliensis]AKU16113.1 hypothetical protein VV02_09985 [Luteipulveratus mongoliensis]
MTRFAWVGATVATVLFAAGCSDSSSPTLSAPKDPLQVRVVVLRKAAKSGSPVERFSEPVTSPSAQAATLAALRWAPSPAEERAFTEFRCTTAGAAPAAKPLMACDALGVAYLLSPAAIDGHVTSAASKPDQSGKWAVDVTFDKDGGTSLSSLSESLSKTADGSAGKRRPMAFQRARMVAMAGEVLQPIAGGKVQLASFSRDRADQLARDIMPT